MKNFILNPKSPEAFTTEVLHRVVLNGIDFDLPVDIWDVIDDAFGHYWNVEVGFGNYPDLYSAVESIHGWMLGKGIIYSKDNICKIVNVIFDWIEQIPGAILDESDVVIPHDYSADEEKRQALKKIDKELKAFKESYGEPITVFDDSKTDFVYISDKLKEYNPDVYTRLTKLFDDMNIAWGEVEGTNDIWIRDYMPIQLGYNDFLNYRYYPDYLVNSKNRKGVETITDATKVLDSIDISYRTTNIIIDGGNMVMCGPFIVMTDKVFTENGYEKGDENFRALLESELRHPIIFIPWTMHGDFDAEETDKYGHSDGFIKWCGNSHILMGNHGDEYPEEAFAIRSKLENYGFKVTEMRFKDKVSCPDVDFNWAYINYLQVGNKIIVPVLGKPEDKLALDYIKDANPDCFISTFRMKDILNYGGALHCITWNIKKKIKEPEILWGY